MKCFPSSLIILFPNFTQFFTLTPLAPSMVPVLPFLSRKQKMSKRKSLKLSNIPSAQQNKIDVSLNTKCLSYNRPPPNSSTSTDAIFPTPLIISPLHIWTSDSLTIQNMLRSIKKNRSYIFYLNPLKVYQMLG